MEAIYLIPHVIPVKSKVLGNCFAFALLVFVPTNVRQNRHHVERAPITVPQQAVENPPNLVPSEQIRQRCRRLPVHRVGCQSSELHIAGGKIDHEFDVFKRHVGIPTTDHPTHRGWVERLDSDLGDP